MSDTLLTVEDLKVHFKLPRPHLFGPNPIVHAVDGVSFGIKRGTTFGLVGESGSGKTSLLMLMSGLEKPSTGSIFFENKDLGTWTIPKGEIEDNENILFYRYFLIHSQFYYQKYQLK